VVEQVSRQSPVGPFRGVPGVVVGPKEDVFGFHIEVGDAPTVGVSDAQRDAAAGVGAVARITSAFPPLPMSAVSVSASYATETSGTRGGGPDGRLPAVDPTDGRSGESSPVAAAMSAVSPTAEYPATVPVAARRNSRLVDTRRDERALRPS